MADIDWWNKSYHMKVTHRNDEFYVSKIGGSDWSDISLKVNEQSPVFIQFRSKEAVEAVYFMIGQMLGKS